MHLIRRRIRSYWPLALALLTLSLLATGALVDRTNPSTSQVPASLPPGMTGDESALRLAAHTGQIAGDHAQAAITPTPTPGTFGPITGPPNTGTQPNPTAPPAQTTPTAAERAQPTPVPVTVVATTVPPTTIPATPTATVPPPSPTPAITATPPPALDPNQIGVQINPDLSEEDFDTMLWLAGKLGVKWLKFQFAWNLMEPNPGEYNSVFNRYVLWVQRANQKGFNVLLSIAKAPLWSRPTADEHGPPSDPALLGRVLADFLNRVRVDLRGQSYVDAIEVWNEPNLVREWNGLTLSGAEYMRYFDAAYHAIRGAEGGSTVTIVSAGLAPTGINDGVVAVDDRVYLEQMYQAGLNNPAYQNIAIGVHPYGAANPPDARCCSDESYANDPTWFFLDTIEDYRAIMERYNDGARQLWVTEFGWGTYEGFVLEDGSQAPGPVDPPYLNWLTQEQQAHYIIRAFEIGQNLPYVGPMFLWNLNFSRNEYIAQRDPRAAYAILRNTSDPLRPAFRLIQLALTGTSD